LYVEDLGIPEINDMLSRYNIFELSCALKPFYANYLITQKGAQQLLYFDSDVVVYNRLLLFEQYPDHHIFLTPHLLIQDGLNKRTELQMLTAGIYNGGFFAIRDGEEPRLFLRWWKERMAEFSYQGKKGLFVDQIWLNFVPVYFKNVMIINDPGYNVAYWNLPQRVVSSATGNYRVNNQHDLLFFHFSGFNASKADQLSIYEPTLRLCDFPEIAALVDSYRHALKSHRFQTFAGHKPTLGTSDRVRPSYKNEQDRILRSIKKIGYLVRKAIGY
jgi:hypothetical protein